MRNPAHRPAAGIHSAQSRFVWRPDQHLLLFLIHDCASGSGDGNHIESTTSRGAGLTIGGPTGVNNTFVKLDIVQQKIFGRLGDSGIGWVVVGLNTNRGRQEGKASPDANTVGMTCVRHRGDAMSGRDRRIG